MEQPSSPRASSQQPTRHSGPRVARKTCGLATSKKKGATRMPISSSESTVRVPKLAFWLCCASLLAGCVLLAVNSSAQDSSRSPGWVVLPVDEYRSLHDRAYPLEHEPEPPPVDATLTRVDYDLRVNGDLASGRAVLTIDVLKDGWVRVP